MNRLAPLAVIQIAARAGRRGKGFAASAPEVKYLSKPSTPATEHVRTILHDMQKAPAAHLDSRDSRPHAP